MFLNLKINDKFCSLSGLVMIAQEQMLQYQSNKTQFIIRVINFKTKHNNLISCQEIFLFTVTE